MAKPANDEIDVESIESSESVAINSSIKKFMMRRESVENSDKKLQYYTSQASKLLESNCNIETNCGKLMLKISDVDAKILESTRTHIMKKQELRNYQRSRTDMLNKQWDDCLSEIGNYANDFSRWITEYSRNVLIKDIESHREDCKKVGDELAILQQEVNDMKREYDLDYIEANVDVNDLQNLDTVISDLKSSNNNLTRAIRSTEDTLNKIQNQIKQSKVVVNAYKTKEKTNMF